MNKSVFLVVEGLTEQLFCEQVLAPYLAPKGIYLHASQIHKRGCCGGDVRFSRAKASLLGYFKQRNDTIVGTFVDYYGLKEWPTLNEVRNAISEPVQIADRLNMAAARELEISLPKCDVRSRFAPFIAVHEFESLLFSDPVLLATAISVNEADVRSVIEACGSPERINNSPQTAPSKRLETWTGGRYGKTTQGISIAARIGVNKMREQCPNFDAWLKRLESTI